MCWDANVSIQTFALGMLSISTAALNNYPLYHLVFYFSFVSVQLAEYFIWTFYDNPIINSYATVGCAFVILSQPFASILTMYKNRYLRKNMYMMMLFYGLSVLYYIWTTLYYNPNWIETFRSCEGKNGHLVWNWISKENINVPITTSYLIFFFLPMIINRDWQTFVLALLTLKFSLYFFWKYETWGTMWCWTANLADCVLLFKNIKHVLWVH